MKKKLIFISTLDLLEREKKEFQMSLMFDGEAEPEKKLLQSGKKRVFNRK